MYSRGMASDPTNVTNLHLCSHALIPKEAAETLMKYRTVGRVMHPSEVTTDMVAEVKAASAAVMECEKPKGHEPPHKCGETEWTDDEFWDPAHYEWASR